jgi:hypothetical protein
MESDFVDHEEHEYEVRFVIRVDETALSTYFIRNPNYDKVPET